MRSGTGAFPCPRRTPAGRTTSRSAGTPTAGCPGLGSRRHKAALEPEPGLDRDPDDSPAYGDTGGAAARRGSSCGAFVSVSMRASVPAPRIRRPRRVLPDSDAARVRLPNAERGSSPSRRRTPDRSCSTVWVFPFRHPAQTLRRRRRRTGNGAALPSRFTMRIRPLTARPCVSIWNTDAARPLMRPDGCPRPRPHRPDGSRTSSALKSAALRVDAQQTCRPVRHPERPGAREDAQTA